METATFALGCFWDPDARFGSLEGVLTTRVGFCGGTNPDIPTYKSIGDYTESIQIEFDSNTVAYAELLNKFKQWYIPNTKTTRTQYAAAIFFHDEKQQQQVNNMSIENIRLEQYGKFHLAEERHQKYYLKRTLMLTDVFGNQKDWIDKDPAMLTKLNGFLAGYGTKTQFQTWNHRRTLNHDQQDFIREKLTE